MAKKRAQSLELPMKSPLRCDLVHVKPLTNNQIKTFQLYQKGYNLLLHGVSGSGKTFIALYLAFEEFLNNPGRYENITIYRSVVPSREIGFIPGTVEEKQSVYERPYMGILAELFKRYDAYQIQKDKHTLEFQSTSFLRGSTLNRKIVIVDEINNMSFQELDTIITRVGDGTRIIFCGDYRQTDLVREKEKEGLQVFMNILGYLDEFARVEFTTDDIIRSSLVKSYIIAREKLKDEKEK